MNIDIAGPDINSLDVQYVIDAMKNGWYGKDKYFYVETFQKEFAKYHNRKFGIMTPNCTMAIHLLLKGLGIRSGDEVIVPDITWVGSTAGITYCSAIPIFCDIEKDSWCLDPQSVEDSITENTKAIITVNLFGNMSNMSELEKISEKYNVPLIEDSAQSLGSKYFGKKAGKFGIGSAFSFHRTKTITTGEGGMLLLDDEELYERCMFLRDHGRNMKKMYWVDEVSVKYMPFNLQAALGYAQFCKIEKLIEKKRSYLHFYKEKLSHLDVKMNIETKNIENGAWITGMLLGKEYNINKNQFIDKMKHFGLDIRPFFYPLSSMDCYDYKQQHHYMDKNKNAYDISSRGVNLPGALNLTEEKMQFVCSKVLKILE